MEYIKKALETAWTLLLTVAILSLVASTLISFYVSNKVTNLYSSCDGEIHLVQWKYGCSIGGEQTSCQVVQCVQTP